MDKVSVKFNVAGKWALDIYSQIEVEEGQVVNGLEYTFACKVVEAGKGEIVDAPVVEEVDDTEPTTEDASTEVDDNPEDLHSMGMPELKAIATPLGVRSTSKKGLIAGIEAARAA